MTKYESRLWGLDKIFALLDPPSDFIASIKRSKLNHEHLSADELAFAYERRGLLLSLLRQRRHMKWHDLLSPISEIHASSYAAGNFALHEIFDLKHFIWHYQALRKYCLEQGITLYDLPDLSELFALLDPEKNNIPSFRLSPAYSPTLAKLDTLRDSLALKLKHARHKYLQEAIAQLGIDGLKEEFVLPRSARSLIQSLNQSPYFVLHRESIANLHYILADSDESLQHKSKLAEINQEIAQEEEAILKRLSQQIVEQNPLLERAIDSFRELAWDYTLAEFAYKYDCVIPRISDEIQIQRLRNLPLQLALENDGRQYQSLDISFGKAANLIIGPNMGGKTSILKSLAQCAIMAKIGIPLPAEQANIPLFDFVYYNHAGETDSLSSFGAEVVSFCTALKRSGRGLFLLDEFAKGTNPREGEALATAVIEHLAESHHTTVAATHFSAPTRLKNARKYQIKGIDKSFAQKAGDDLTANLKALANAMDYSLISLDEGQTPPLDALKIARILGMPDEILARITQED
nr:mismatch repair protein MutS2 [Candidatus Cloacimonadota bacterium]